VAAHGSPKLLVARAEVALDGGDAGLALACADEALRAAPRLVPALSLRAAALTSLRRLDEARLAYALALALDPDDPETLQGAADLYVSRVDGDRSTLQLGLEYALRGARSARRAPRPDRELIASLLLLAATAENDLGDNREALAHADEALRATPRDPDLLYERGVALYELCRFAEARAALEAVLGSAPDDAWTLHYLSLVAERTGDAVRADVLEHHARDLAPDEIPAPIDVDRQAFQVEVEHAIAALPDAERRALREVPVEVADVPSIEDLTAVDPPLSPSILGLFRGPPEREPCLPEDGPRCRSIVFYRRNLARFARSWPELDEQVRVTLLHELGHLHGETDDDLRARGLE
jgi:predicted Zn-dependent protease with MMP-like domain/Flp pilus assembly protein TadD